MMKVKLIAVLQNEYGGGYGDDEYSSVFNTILSDFKTLEVDEKELQEKKRSAKMLN